MSLDKKVYECHIQAKLEQQLRGKHEICPAGVADIVTQTELIEIKTWDNWKTALGQVISYHVYFPDKMTRVHFFGLIPSIEKRLVIISHFTRNNIQETWENDSIKICQSLSCTNIVNGSKDVCTSCSTISNNNLNSFMDENLEKLSDSNSYIELTLMYGRYRDWFREKYSLKPMDRKIFIHEMKKDFKYDNRRFYNVKFKSIFIDE